MELKKAEKKVTEAKVLGAVGFTTVYKKGKFVYIEHCGNMGANIAEVVENLEIMGMTEKTIANLFAVGTENGHPSYLWTLKVKIPKTGVAALVHPLEKQYELFV